MENLEKTQISQRFSAQPNPYIPLVCDIHDEQIFNFCLNLECLKPLCPECINDHQEYHNEKSSKPDFTTIRGVKSSCSKKIEAGILSLNQEVKKCELEYLLDPEALIEVGMRRLKKFRERMHFMIESYSAQLEETLKRRVHENILKGSDFEGIFEDMKNIIKELDFLRKNLDSSSGVTYIKKICLLDLKSLMTEFKSKVHRVIKTKDLEPIDIHVDENKFIQFKSDLENMIFIKRDPKEVEYSNIEVNQSKVKEISYENLHKDFLNDPNEILEKNLENERSKEIVSQINIQVSDYYNNEAEKPLHFFQKSKRILYVADLQNKDLNFKKYNLKNEVPGFFKSISTPDGSIYLIGGQMAENFHNKLNEIYRFFEKDIEMKQVGALNIARSCHSLCVVKEFIYIIGGYSKTNLCSQVERFNISSKKCELLPEQLKQPSAYSSVCSFPYAIFKFGGLGANEKLLQTIEKFDLVKENWQIINWMPERTKDFKLLLNSACIQINNAEILLVGGHDVEDKGSNQCFLFKYDKNHPDLGTVKEMDKNFLLQKNNGFCHNEGVVEGEKVYFLQNKGNNSMKIVNEDEKLVLVLGKKGWCNPK